MYVLGADRRGDRGHHGGRVAPTDDEPTAPLAQQGVERLEPRTQEPEPRRGLVMAPAQDGGVDDEQAHGRAPRGCVAERRVVLDPQIASEPHHARRAVGHSTSEAVCMTST